ncbi:MAG: tRNA (adenosine(37)-N6)-dimethylallyltransferase MiaA [Pelovirga sp.]
MHFDTLVILGATAGGKTALAVAAARRFGGEIISADSRQVYRGMDLGTGKDLAEYGEVPCHLIDIVAAGTEYNLFRFQRDCYAALAAIRQRRRLPLICGGTGLYLDAVLRNYQLADVPIDPALRQRLAGQSDEELRQLLLQLRPQQHNRTDLADRDRLVRACEIALGEQSGAIPAGSPPLVPLVFGLRWPREVLRQRIAARLAERLQAGMIEEVEQLHAAGIGWEQLEFYGLEYRMIAWHLQGRLSRNDMEQKLRSAIGQFAKRQETFFRRMEKQGVAIHWLDGPADPFGTLCRIVAEHDLSGVRNGGPL